MTQAYVQKKEKIFTASIFFIPHLYLVGGQEDHLQRSPKCCQMPSRFAVASLMCSVSGPPLDPERDAASISLAFPFLLAMLSTLGKSMFSPHSAWGFTCTGHISSENQERVMGHAHFSWLLLFSHPSQCFCFGNHSLGYARYSQACVHYMCVCMCMHDGGSDAWLRGAEKRDSASFLVSLCHKLVGVIGPPRLSVTRKTEGDPAVLAWL